MCQKCSRKTTLVWSSCGLNMTKHESSSCGCGLNITKHVSKLHLENASGRDLKEGQPNQGGDSQYSEKGMKTAKDCFAACGAHVSQPFSFADRQQTTNQPTKCMPCMERMFQLAGSLFCSCSRLCTLQSLRDQR